MKVKRRKCIIIAVVCMFVLISMFPKSMALEKYSNNRILEMQQIVNIKNGDFEENAVEDNKIIGWPSTNASPDKYKTVAEVSNVESYSGAKSLYLHDPSDVVNLIVTSDKIPVEETETYTVSQMVYRVSDGLNIKLSFFDNEGNQKAYYSQSITTAANQWTRISITKQAPAGSAYAQVVFYISKAEMGEAYVDNVIFMKHITETLVNGDFEQEINIDGGISGWNMIYGTSDNFIITDNASAPSGNYCLQLIDNDPQAGVGLESNPIRVLPGETYQTTVMLGTDQKVLLYLRFYDSAGNRLTNNAVPSTTDNINTWAPLSFTQVAPVNAAYATVLLYSTSSGTATAHFDDVQFKKLQPVYTGTFTNLGTQVTRAIVTSATIVEDSAKNQYACVGVNGNPAQFVVIDIKSGEVMKKFDLPGATQAWAMVTGMDGKVYVGASRTGRMYRYVPGANQLEDLGKPVKSESHIWSLVNGSDGKIYAALYPNGKVAEYDISTNTFKDLGTMAEGEKYVRSITYDIEDEVLYVGTGTSCRIIRYDLKTGEKIHLLSDEYKLEQFPTSLDIIDGKLFVKLSKTNRIIVLDTETGEIEKIIENAANNVIQSPIDDKVFIFADKYLNTYEIITKELTPIIELDSNTYPRNLDYMQLDEENYPGLTLVAWVGNDTLFKYNLQTAHYSKTLINVPGQPNNISSLKVGPDGKIYSGGYMGGLGSYDPITGINETYIGVSQPEGITTMRNKIYLGGYPHARIYELNTSKPWNIKNENPAQIFQVPEEALQDRPYGMLAVNRFNKLFVGTVAQYGQNEGALSIYDFSTGELNVQRNIVSNQSVISLAYHKGKVYGGTSVWGGLGIEPTASEGKLFVWDVEKEEKELEIVPVPGKRTVTGLMKGPDGMIWGVAEGVLFIYNPKEEAITFTKEIMPISYVGTSWKDAFMDIGNDGNVYGTASGYFFKVDQETKEITILNQDIPFTFFAQDQFGNFYFTHAKQGYRHELWKYTDEKLLLNFSEVIISTSNTEIVTGQKIKIKIAGQLENGEEIEGIERANTEYIISDPGVLKVEDGRVIPISEGTSSIKAQVTINNVTIQSNEITITVIKNIGQ